MKDTPVLMAGNNSRFTIGNAAKGLAVAAAMPIVAVPIQDVQLLDYVVAHKTVNSSYGITASMDDIYMGLFGNDPYTSDQQRARDCYEINDTDWNEVVFKEVNGTSIAKLALHQDWIKQKSYAVNEVVNLNLPEQGIQGPFRITSIKHIIPQKKPTDEDPEDDYDYKPVTALFIHQSDAVYNITFGGSETIGVTYQHPIFSVTAGDWKLAGELEVGEKVLTKSGEATVTSSEKKGGAELVYNLEVKDLHNFLVGNEGVVVHNSCWKLYMDSFFSKWTKKADPNNNWVDYIEESGLGSLKERQQLSRLGEHEGERMTILTKDKTGQDFPGIDGVSASGRPISLKEITSSNSNTLTEKIKDIGKKATNAQGASLPQLVDVDGMVTATNFTKAEIKTAIDVARANEPRMGIVKKIFIEGSDGSVWY